MCLSVYETDEYHLEQLTTKEEDVNNNIVVLRTVKEELKESVARGRELYHTFTSKRNQVIITSPSLGWSLTDFSSVHSSSVHSSSVHSS